MEQELTLVRIGHSARLERLLPQALAGLRVKELPPEQKKFPGAYTRDRILEMLEKEQHGLTGDQEAAGQH